MQVPFGHLSPSGRVLVHLGLRPPDFALGASRALDSFFAALTAYVFAPFIVNFDALAAHLIHRLRRQHAISGDPVLADLLAEAEALAPSASDIHPLAATAALELQMRRNGIDTRYLSVVSTFGTALDVTADDSCINQLCRRSRSSARRR